MPNPIPIDPPSDPAITSSALATTDANDRSSEKLLDRTKLNDVVRELSKPCPWRVVWAITLQWSVIAVAIAAAVWSHHWLVYLLAMFVIGTRQHGLAVLAHDGAHFRLFETRWLNNAVSDLFCFLPIGIGTGPFRYFHFQHHQYVNTEKDSEVQFMQGDEDWMFPKLPWQCAKLLVKDLLGLNSDYMAKLIWWWSPWSRLVQRKTDRYHITGAERARVLLLAATVATILTLTHTWLYYLILWFVPTMTALVFINRIRSLAEHFGVEKENELNASRHVTPTWWERLIFCPCNVNYHLEHHLFPSVPFFNLPRLHQRLMQEEVFRARAHITLGYTSMLRGVLAEVTTKWREAKVAAA